MIAFKFFIMSTYSQLILIFCVAIFKDQKMFLNFKSHFALSDFFNKENSTFIITL